MRRKRGVTKTKSVSAKKRKADEVEVDWDIESDEESSDGSVSNRPNERDEEDEDKDSETVDEMRIRLAREYLKRIGADEAANSADRDDDDDDSVDEEVQVGVTGERTDPDSISKRLRKELLSQQGRLRRPVAQRLRELSKVEADLVLSGHISKSVWEGHKKPLTCIAISEAEDCIYSGSKDCCIIKWDAETGKQLHCYRGLPKSKTFREIVDFPGHRDEVLAIALSSDGKYLASAGKEKLVYIWDTRTQKLIERLKGHRDAITSLVFQMGTYTLMSASLDRSVRIWNVEELSFVDELYGHLSGINAIDSLYRERAITCSIDRSVRFWKIPEETQLVFQTYHKASVDTVKMVDEVHFFAGSQDGSISLWHTSKKRPSSVVEEAHDGDWIISVTALRNSNLLASASRDGHIKLWEANFEQKSIHSEPCAVLGVNGFVNAMAFSSSGKLLVAATGTEHRLGRWETDKSGINGLQVFRLSPALVANESS